MTGPASSLYALVFNVAVSTFFVIVPCEILRLGAGSLEVGLSAALHSISYIVFTVINGRLAVQRPTQLALVRLSCVALALLYAICAVIRSVPQFLVVSALNGCLMGTYWPNFWATHEDESQHDLWTGLCSSFIWLNVGLMLGPTVAGLVYGRSGALSFLLGTGLLIVLQLVMGRLPREAGEAIAETDELPEADCETARLRTSGTVWVPVIGAFTGAFIVGFVDGSLRAAGPVMVSQSNLPSSYWGALLAIKAMAQVVSLLLLRRARSAWVAVDDGRRAFLVGAVTILLGSALFAFGSAFWIRSAAVAFMGLGYGLVNFAAIYLSILWTQVAGRNLSGYAEGVLGAGILSGSLLGGVLVGRSVQSQFLVACVLEIAFVCLLLWSRKACTVYQSNTRRPGP
ncbi:MAG TPA: hypothetical protein DDZ84_02270 [Firmicutes bacterium]|nr:hypothetical protein [Bacillota bacterium]